MRVIGGQAKGRRLEAPAGLITRPMADRVKEAVFNILGPIDDTHVLDLFAGSGSLALEALSRGAAGAVLVEVDRRALFVAGRNVERLGFSAHAKLVPMKVATAASVLERDGRVFDLAFVDPPYQSDLLGDTLTLLGSGGLLAEGAWVVAHYYWRQTPADDYGALALDQERRYGQAAIRFYRRTG